MEGLITADELARELKVTPRFIRRIVADRRIEYIKAGRCVRFTREAVEDYKRRNTFAALTRAELRRSLAGV